MEIKPVPCNQFPHISRTFQYMGLYNGWYTTNMAKIFPGRNLHSIYTYVKPYLYRDINELAEVFGMSRSALIRHALIAYLERHYDELPSKRTPLEFAGPIEIEDSDV